MMRNNNAALFFKILQKVNMQFILLIICVAVVATGLVDSCNFPKNPGRACGKSPETRWYFNDQKSNCLAFTYLGCSGNKNNFPSAAACETECSTTDGRICDSAAFTPPAMLRRSDGKPGRCEEMGCPEGFVCMHGMVGSGCCNKTGESWFAEAHHKNCKNGKNAHLINGTVHVGDSCNDLTCPMGYSCETTNPLFAKCCATS